MPRWLGLLTLAGAAAAAETADACLRNLGPQQLDEVCGSDGIVYDSYAHALCHNAVDAGWRRGACERRALSDRISTVAPPTSYESASTRASIETVDETN